MTCSHDSVFFAFLAPSRSLRPLRSVRPFRSLRPRNFAALLVAATIAIGTQAQAVVASFEVVDDAIPQPLTATSGDAAKGRAIVANRQAGLCLLCHTAPIAEERFQGNLAPDLAGVGSRLTAGQLRLRIVDARRTNPQTIMPPYQRTEGLQRVGAAFVDKPLLGAQDIEDVVAYLVTLKAPAR